MSLQDRKTQKSVLSAAKALFQKETEQNTVLYAKERLSADKRLNISVNTEIKWNDRLSEMPINQAFLRAKPQK